MISMRKQSGMALFIAMLILPLLLVLGVLVMSNSFLGLKIIDTRVMQSESNIKLDSAAQQILAETSPTAFAAAEDDDVFASGDVSGKVSLQGELNCRRIIKTSGSNFKCKYLQLNLDHSYGRAVTGGGKSALNSMGLGIEQPILAE